MSREIIQQRLESYHCQSKIEEELALKEITQEIALMGLQRAGFFKVAAFQGGTCLRIFHGLQRFSEDLDFVLFEPSSKFQWDRYLPKLIEELRIYEYEIEIQDRSDVPGAIKKAFLKTNSLGNLLTVSYPHLRDQQKKLRIKLEVDIVPPSRSKFETLYLHFPLITPVVCQDLPSLFASKSHALLCREYMKGRDWYDFILYVNQGVEANYSLLSQALDQMGPWKGQRIQVTSSWYKEAMLAKIKSIDWDKAREDVSRFLKPHELPSLELWSADLFTNVLNRYAKN